jgi:hypothetical protein
VRLVVLTRSIETLTCVMLKRAAAVLEVVVGSSWSVATTSRMVGGRFFSDVIDFRLELVMTPACFVFRCEVCMLVVRW